VALSLELALGDGEGVVVFVELGKAVVVALTEGVEVMDGETLGVAVTDAVRVAVTVRVVVAVAVGVVVARVTGGSAVGDGEVTIAPSAGSDAETVGAAPRTARKPMAKASNVTN